MSRAEGALLVLGAIALLRAACAGLPPPPPAELGEPLDLAPEALAGDAFRLVPGVGPVLARRLEEARVAAGGVLRERDLGLVQGVGPVLRERWRDLAAPTAAALASRAP